jgi:hypothetical protein
MEVPYARRFNKVRSLDPQATVGKCCPEDVTQTFGSLSKLWCAFANREVSLLPHGQPLFTYCKWRDVNNTMSISFCRQECQSSTLCSKTKSWSLEALRQSMIMTITGYTCNVPNKEDPDKNVK